MKSPDSQSLARRAILAVMEIKSALDEFEQGDVNVFDALQRVATALEVYRTAERQRDAA
jgi:hypothetical protein